MAKQFQAKVAKLLTPTRLAINAGRDKGVTVGDVVTMFRTEVIQDPDTQEELDRIQLEKLQLVVDDVREKISIARVTSRRNPPGANYLNRALAGTMTIGERSRGDVDVIVQVGETVLVTHSEPPAKPPS